MNYFRVAFRSLFRSPTLAMACIASIALGVGAVAAVFAAIDTLILRPFPYASPDRLYSLVVADPAFPTPLNRIPVERFQVIAEKSSSFSGFATGDLTDINVSTGDLPRFLRASYVNSSLFDTMGVSPTLGRTFSPADAEPSAPSVCVLSHKTWQTHFAGNPNILGTQFKANGLMRTVIGVMPARFLWRRVDMYLLHNPRGIDPEPVRSLNVVGRLKPGVTQAQAEAELSPIFQELRRSAQPPIPPRAALKLEPFRKAYGSNLTDHLWALLAGVLLLLLTACANVSSLLVAHGFNRQRDFSIRKALGAPQSSIARMILTESLILSAAGAILGAGLAYLLVHLVRTLLPPNLLPAESELQVNPLVLAVCAALAAIAAVGASLAPIVFSGREPLATVLRESGRTSTASARKRSLRTIFTVLEIALAVMLLSGSGLLLESLLQIQDFDTGYDPRRIVGFRLPFNEVRYPDRARRQALLDRIGADLRGIPGVERVSFSTSMHPYQDFQMAIEAPGQSNTNLPAAQIRQIGLEYPQVFRTRLIEGRFFNRSEFESRTPVALINQSTARLYFPGASPIGQRVRIPALGRPPYSLPQYNADGVDVFTIIGVTGDRTNQGIHRPVAPEVSIPSSLVCVSSIVMIESDGLDTRALLRAAHERVLRSDPDMAISDAASAAKGFNDMYIAGPSTVTLLAIAFAISALLLAAVGLFGLISANVASRTAEFGIRMALGAKASDVLGLVLRGGLRILLAGAVIGLAGSLVAARFLANVLFQTSPWSIECYLYAVGALAVVGLFAAWRPAHRATRVDPADALRQG